MSVATDPSPDTVTVAVTVTPTQDFRAEAAWSVEAAGSRLTPFLTATPDGSVQVNYASAATSDQPAALLTVGEIDKSSTGWAPLGSLPLGSWQPDSYASRIVTPDGSDAIALWSTLNPSGAAPGMAAATAAIGPTDGYFQIVPVTPSGEPGEPVPGTAAGTSPFALTQSPLHLPPASRLVLESAGGPMLGLLAPTPMQIRDLTTLQAAPVAGIPFTLPWYAPLPSVSATELHLACLSSPYNGVASLFTGSVVFDASDPTWSWSFQQGPPICAEAFSATACGSVVDWGAGKVESVTVDAPGDGSTAPRIVTVAAEIDPAAGTTAPAWQSAVVTPLDLPKGLRVTSVWTVLVTDGLLAFFQGSVTDSSGVHSQLWMAGRDLDTGAWASCVMLDSGAALLDVLPHATGLSILVQRDGSQPGSPVGYEVWRRGDDSSFEVSFVDIESPSASLTESQGYRIGISLSHNDAVGSDAAAVLTLSASESVRCTIDGAEALLHAAPRSVQSSGSTWVTVPMIDGFSVPTLTVAVPGLATPLVIDPSAAVHTFLATVSAADLGGAVDPRTGTAVLKAGVSADAVSAVLRQTMSLVPTAHGSLADPAWAHWELDATGIITPLSEGQATERRAVLLGAPRPDHEVLAALRPNVHIVPMGVFGDVWNALKEISAAVWHAVVKVTGIVVRGAEAAITLIVDGVTYAIEAVIDTVSKALDVVGCIMDRVGAAVGSLVGWLLSKLGFLFDWDALKKRRDDVRVLLRGAMTATTTRLPDPAGSAAGFAAEIAAVRQQFDQWFGSLASSPSGAITLAATRQQSGEPSGLESAVESALTWLLDKASSVLSRQIPLLNGPAIDGLGPAAVTALTGLDTAGTALATTVADFQRTATGLITDPETLFSRPLDSLIAVMESDLDVAFDGVGQAVTGVGAFCHLLWANPDKVIDWLDTPLPPSYFGGFYRGLTGHDPSVFELLCMSVAICWPSGAPVLDPGNSGLVANNVDAVGGRWNGMEIAAEVLGSIGVLTTAASTFADLVTGGNVPAFSLLHAGVTLVRVNIVAYDGTTDPRIHAMLWAGDGLVALAALLYCIPQVRAWIGLISPLTRKAVVTLVSVTVLIYQLARADTGPAIAIGVTSLIQQVHALGVVVGQYEVTGGVRQAPMDPVDSAVMAGIQATFSSLNVGFYAWAVESGAPSQPSVSAA